MSNKLNFYILVSVTCLIVIIFALEVQKFHFIYGQVQSNVTSKVCMGDGTCVTTICINNEPCKTVKSNLTSSSSEDNSTDTENKSQPLSNLPGQIV